MDPSILIPIGVALVTGVVTYLTALRKMSGRVSTTNADALWAEAGKMREAQEREIQRSRERQDSSDDRTRELEKRVASLEGRNNELERENYELRKKVLVCESIAERHERTIAEQATTIEALRRDAK